MKLLSKQVILAVGLVVFALGLLAGAYQITKLPEQRFLAKIRLPQGTLASYNSFEEANAALLETESQALNTKVTLTVGANQASLSLSALGVGMDSEALHQYLSEGPKPFEKIRLFFLGKDFETPLTLDTEKAHLALTPYAFEKQPKNAGFLMENGALKLQASELGYSLDEVAFLAEFQNAWDFGFGLPTELALPLLEKEPELTTLELEAVRGELEPLIGKTLVLKKEESASAWELPLAEHLNWFTPTEGTLTLDTTAVEATLQELVLPEVEQEPQGVTITMDENGKYVFEGSARFGVKVKREDLLATLQSQFLLPEFTWELNLPIEKIQPEITAPAELEAQGVTDLLSVGYTTFYGSPTNRVHNINVGMNKFNGVVIQPGENFVFNDLMGEISAAEGWRAELVIKGNDTIPEFGGGLCQVSTTAYRAALFYGLPIVERQNHSYAVSYYSQVAGHGLDATIYDPAPRFVFNNDTGAPILIQSYADGYEAFFVFYGKNDGRTVKMEGPYAYDYSSIGTPQITYTDKLPPGERQLESYAHTGFKVDWYRTITYGDGTVGARENIHSNYRAMPAKYLEGKAADAAAPVEG